MRALSAVSRARSERLVGNAIGRGRRVIHVSAHSFTPGLDGKVRTADVGLLYDPARPGEVRLCARSGRRRSRARRRSCASAATIRTRATTTGSIPYLRSRFPPQRLRRHRARDEPGDRHRSAPAAGRHCGRRSSTRCVSALALTDKESHANPRRMRIDLRVSPADTDDPDAEHPLHAGVRHRPAGSPGHRSRRCRSRAYRDSFGNWCSRIVAPAGVTAHHHRCAGQRQRTPGSSCRRARADAGRIAARGDADLSSRQPLLRNRAAVRDRLAAVRQRSHRLGSRPGHLRLRPRPHPVRLRARAPDQDRVGGLSRRRPASAATSLTSPSPSAAA